MALEGHVFPQNVIAMVWDFDKTLVPGYMQKPIFARYKINERRFWDEVNALPAYYAERGVPLFPNDIGYLSHMLTYVREGIFKNLSNQMLYELGGELKFYPGLPAFFGKVKKHIEDDPRFARHGIKLEHYVVSTGLIQMIQGSRLAKYVDGIWACEFLSTTAPPKFLGVEDEPKGNHDADPIQAIAYAIDNTTKTRAIFEINKGVNKHPIDITVNDKMADEDRRVPIEHMIYVADGPSDVPVFSIVKHGGGKTFAVWGPDQKEFRQANGLLEQGRVLSIGPADYKKDTQTARTLTLWAEEIAERIAERWQAQLGEHIGKPPKHILPDEGASEGPP